MDKLAVTGDTIVLDAPPGVTFLAPAIVQLQGLQCARRITSSGQPVVLEADLPACALSLPALPYSTPTHTIPGTLMGLQLTVNPATLSQSVATTNQKVITAATTGTYTMSLGTPPAMMPPPGPGPPTPDPVAVKTGTWSVKTVVQPFFSSGIPQSPPATGDDQGLANGGGGPGAGSTDESASDDKDHYVALTVEDEDGNKLANQIVFVTIPSGERFTRQLSAGGGTRVDDIKKLGDGEATVNMVFDARLVPIGPGETADFIAIEVLDEDGAPFAGYSLKIAIDGEDPAQLLLNDSGRARIDGVPPRTQATLELRLSDGGQTGIIEDGGKGTETGSGEQSATPTTTTLRLIDSAGEPIAGQRITLTASSGETAGATSDEAGIVVVELAVGGKLEVTFDE